MSAAERVPWGTLLAFALPALGYSFYLFFVQFFFLKFATDVLLLAPALIGVLFGAGRIWDAVSDPLAGYWSDRTRSRLGRRRPWMLAGVPLLAISFLMLWGVPEGMGGVAQLAWAGLALLGFYTAYTVYSIPHQSLGAELSRDFDERSRVFGSQRMAFVAGMMLAFTAMDFVGNSPSPRASALLVALVASVVASLLLLVAPARLRERREHQGRGGQSPLGAMRDVAANPHARILLATWFVDGLGGGVIGVLAPFVTDYVMRRPDLIGVIPAFFVVAGVAAIPAWIALSRRFGKRRVWMAAMIGGGLCFGATFFVGEGDLALLCVLLVGAGACMGCGGAIGQSILADVIDYDEYASGERKEGAYSAAWGFALKLAIGSVIVLTGFALQLSGFAPNQEQSETAELTLRVLFAGTPLLASLAGAAILSRLTLGRVEHEHIRREIASRAEGDA
jgi:GPH family glycoside/pentoside/hexuronide:cation symporter